jgi:hypothetical protein
MYIIQGSQFNIGKVNPPLWGRINMVNNNMTIHAIPDQLKPAIPPGRIGTM